MPERLISWIICIAALFGVGATYAGLPRGFDPGRNHPGWPRRYAALKESLGPAAAVVLVADDPGGTPPYKAFRAQFVLAPAVISRRNLDRLDVRRLASMPFVLDASSRASLDSMIQDVRAETSGSGVQISVERVLQTLAVIRRRDLP